MFTIGPLNVGVKFRCISTLTGNDMSYVLVWFEEPFFWLRGRAVFSQFSLLGVTMIRIPPTYPLMLTVVQK